MVELTSSGYGLVFGPMCTPGVHVPADVHSGCTRPRPPCTPGVHVPADVHSTSECHGYPAGYATRNKAM